MSDQPTPTPEPTPVNIRQDLVILPQKNKAAFLIPCNEWDFLRKKIEKMATNPLLFKIIGSLAGGASITTLLNLISLNFTRNQTNYWTTETIVFAVIFVSCTFLSIAFLVASKKENKSATENAEHIVTHMKLIEERFERQGN